jgi:uncharacterized NAD-dependent epimerase/dehydratase family protein
MRIAILAHGKFPDRAKTAVGLLRYGDHEVVAVLDHDLGEGRVAEHLPDVQDAPIVAGIEDCPPIDALVVGIAPIGGGFADAWRPDVRGALSRGADVWAGLHYFLAEDEEFAALAAEHGCELWDVRRPPEDLTVADGAARELDAEIVLTVGTDCSVGKMTTTMELLEAAREAGLDAGFVPTGQTGVMVDGDGVVVDRVVSDFTAGAVERMLLERADHDYLFVEGQGSITHPAYSAVTCGILHGSMPDALVLCHEAGRETVHGYESFDLPIPAESARLYEALAEPVAPARLAGGALNTAALEPAPAREAVAAFGDAIGAPAVDPVRDGAGELIAAITGDGEG